MRALVTSTQWHEYGDRFRAAAPDVEFLDIDDDGTVRCDGAVVDRADTGAEIAFGSTDLFDGDLREDKVRHFFGWLLGNESLRWLHMAAAGVDNPVFGMLLDNGVRLTTSHHTAVPISEYVLAQVLRARLPLDAMEADRASRTWRTRQWDEVASSRWLVVGMGAIGHEVAMRARAFGASVTGVRRSATGDEPVDTMIEPAGVLAALPHHDVVVLSVPATATTEGMVDAEFLGRLAPDTVLVNVGRGALVDEDALRASLDEGRPRRAVLDVTSTEPLPDGHWLWTHPDVVLTTHTSSGGRQRVERAAAVFADNLRRWTAGSPLTGEVTAATRDAPAPS